jgi:pyruvate,water dikinase
LTLTDPSSAEFSPEKALSLHDLARFIHEKSYEEMFGLGERLGDVRQSSYLLDVFLPLDLYIVDLGGGFVERPKGNKVKPRQIASVPMAALLKGMLDKRIPRFGAKPLSLGGLMAVVMRHATESPDQDRTFADPSYALISQPYLNFTARVGYHFSIVDAYCGATANKNYISLLFRGGAADQVRRNRRVRAIAAILRGEGFAVRVERDAVTARMSKASREETAAHLEMIGRLLQFFRQLDAAMAGEEAVDLVTSAFLRGDYDLLKLAEGRRREG